jgi:hypothetical protein
MAAPLEVHERHHRHEMSDVEARRRGVESDVAGDRALCEGLSGLLRVLEEKVPPFKLV